MKSRCAPFEMSKHRLSFSYIEFMLHYRFLLLPFLCGFAFFVQAQNESDSIRQLREVHVVANRYSEVIPAQRLSGKELEALSSFSVADAIRYFSGVQIKDYGGIGGLKTVDIRSMGTNHMGVFYDGIQLGNAQNGQIDLGKFSLDNVEEISLYNGQKSEIFQAAKDFGSSGTVYLRTRRPRFSQGKTTNVNAYFRTGSFDLLNPSVLWEQKVNDKISASLNAEYVYASGKYKFRSNTEQQDGSVGYDTTMVRENGDIHSMRIEGGFSGVLEKGRWNAKAYFYDSEKGIPGYIRSNKYINGQRQWDRNFFTQGSFQKEITDRYEFLINAKYANDYMRYFSPPDPIYTDMEFLQQEYYISTSHKYNIMSQWDISLAADYQWNILDADLVDFKYPKRHTALVAVATAFEWWRIKAQASFLGTFVFDRVTLVDHGGGELLPGVKQEVPSDKQEYTPAIFASYTPFAKHKLNVRAFYKHIFRMPTLNDLYYTNIGNPALRPEYTKQYNLGVNYAKDWKHDVFKSINIRTDAYFNQVIDKIIAVPKGDGQFRWMMLNLDYVEIRGVDFSGQLLCQLPWDVMMQTNLSYTFQLAQDFSHPDDNDPVFGTYGRQISYIPKHNGSLIARFARKKWDLNYSFIYVGERYHVSANTIANYERPWYTHDLNLGREFTQRKLKGKISLEVNNLANQQFDVVDNYPMPGRNYKLILKLDI